MAESVSFCHFKRGKEMRTSYLKGVFAILVVVFGAVSILAQGRGHGGGGNRGGGGGQPRQMNPAPQIRAPQPRMEMPRPQARVQQPRIQQQMPRIYQQPRMQQMQQMPQ